MDHSVKIDQWQRWQRDLVSQIDSCLAKNVPSEINLGVPRHSTTAPVLRQYAYNQKYKNQSIPIVFADSSRSTAFPIGILSDGPTVPTGGPVLKLGLCSYRHPDLDYLVDLYLMRNRDFGGESSMAGDEAKTYRRTVEMLSEPAIEAGCQIHVFHTGLESMVVGFYRGVSSVLLNRKREGLSRTLVVTPWLYAVDVSTKTGISPESPGAKPESYITSTPWW